MRTSINISLPESLREWVEEQIESGGFGTASEYFRQLLREEQKRKVREQIDDRLIAALDSGEGIELTKQYWEEKRQHLANRVKKGKTRR